MRKLTFPVVAILLLALIAFLSLRRPHPEGVRSSADDASPIVDTRGSPQPSGRIATAVSGGPVIDASATTATPNQSPVVPVTATPALADADPIKPAALKQIEALQAEKHGRTPAQQKLDSQLIDAEKIQRGEPLATGVTTVQVILDKDVDGLVLVDIDARVNDELLLRIAAVGGKVVNQFGKYDAIRARLPLPQMEVLAARDDVKFIRPAVKAFTNVGSVTSEGDVAHRANTARTTFDVNGTGVKVAVLSDSVDHLATSQASGDLGVVTVLPNQSGVPGSGEGTAMLEIIHDLAPGAELFYATAFNGPASFAQNIHDLRFVHHCDIIVDDVGYFNESPFQDGIIAQAVNEVTADGALFFSSAGNAGNKSDGASGTWEGDFVDGGSYSVGGQASGRLHSFGPTTYNTVSAGGSQRHVDLFWADPLGAATNDYDVYVLDAGGNNVVAKSDTTQNGGQDPYEFVNKLDAGQRIVVVRYSGAGRYLYLGTGRGRLNISTPGNTHGHNSAVDAFCVAAVDAKTSFPNPFTGNAKNPVEQFSSDGVRRVFFQANGAPITPGNFSSTGGAVRQKPDIAAADGVVTTLPADSGLNPFFGTSAAAPHAGAVAALLKSYNPALTPGQMRAILTGTALDIESPGVDRDSGAGLVMALPALQAAAGPEQPSITGVSPASGGVGIAVTITGTKFNGATSVKFNGTDAGFTIGSAAQISTTVPAGASTGRITVTTPGGTATSPANFTVLTTPAITDFAPASGSIGSQVILSGVNFTGANSVQFNGVNAPQFTVNSATQITVTVPAGATSGRIDVATAAGTATSTESFTVTTSPDIAGFSPDIGAAGVTVTINGANLQGATAVRFGGVNAPQFTVNSATQITVTVPAGAVSGPLSVTTPNGTATSAASFTIVGAPSVTGFTPITGPVGGVVLVSGANFTGATAVRVGGVAASFTVNSANEIAVTVPAGAVTGPVTVTTAGGVAASPTSFTVLAPASNDNFANAQIITGNSGTVAGNNTAATREVAEPDHADNPGGKSIWYRWTAPASGIWQFDTVGSGFDSLLAVYTGTGVGTLTLIASDDDAPGTTNSSVTVAAVAGITYQIAVDGFRSEGGTAASAGSGNVTLNWVGTPGAPVITGVAPPTGAVGIAVIISGVNLTGATSVTFNGVAAGFTINLPTQITAIVPAGAGIGPIRVTTAVGSAVSAGNFVALAPPANDQFGNAQMIAGTAGTVSGNNTDASKEPGEPSHAGNTGGRSVWYSWVAPASGPWTFDTVGSGFDTTLAVYTGNNVGALVLIASNDDSSPGTISRVSFNAAAGVAYRIAVDGRNGASGSLTLNWAFTPNPPAITGFTPSSGGVGSGVFLTGANYTGATAVRFNGVLAAFAVNSPTQISATVPAGANTGPISVTTPNGTVVSAGSFSITTAPANDQFANAQVLSGNATIVAGQNVAATKEAGEPKHAGDEGGRSVWYRWTAPATGTSILDTAGSGFDTTLAVYTGGSVNALIEVASNDDARADRSSRVTFDVAGGTTYQIAVDGFGGDNGNLVLKLLPTTAPQVVYATGFEVSQGFSTALPLSGQDGWTKLGSGGNGIVDGLFSDLGQQAYVGVLPPSGVDQSLGVWRPLNLTPATNSRPVVRFSVLMAIADSQNSQYDDFLWSVYDIAGKQLFTLDFDNNDLSIYYVLNDGAGYHLTDTSFLNDTINELVVTMDFARNRWSATWNRQPMISELPISSAAGPLDLGDIDAVWLPLDPFAPGDNALVFDEYRVTAGPSEVPAIVLPPQNQTVVAGGSVVLSVVASGGEPLRYQWQFNGVDVPGATNAILNLPNANAGQAGTYSVTASNAAGAVSGSAIVAVNQPAPGTLINGALLPDGRFQFTLTGTTGARSVVEYSADLTQWQELTTVLITNGAAVILDPEAGTQSRRFYRARSQP